MPPFETNRRVATAFLRMTQLLDRRGDNPYRARAYRRGAEAVSSCREPIERLAAEGRLESLAGIGADLASKIVEVLETGTFVAYEQTVRQADPEVQALIQAGFSPDLALLIDSYRRRNAIEELDALASSHLLRSLPGVTKAAEGQILDWVARHRPSTSDPNP
jgi:DNA polymerase (family 10)